MPGGAFLPPLTPFQGADGSDVLGSFLFLFKNQCRIRPYSANVFQVQIRLNKYSFRSIS